VTAALAANEAADKYEAEFHKNYPDGMTVASYCNAEIPNICFLAGAQWQAALDTETIKTLRHELKMAQGCAEMLYSERKRVQKLREALGRIISKSYSWIITIETGHTEKPIHDSYRIIAQEALTDAD
jgi:hypothetical protein